MQFWIVSDVAVNYTGVTLTVRNTEICPQLSPSWVFFSATPWELHLFPRKFSVGNERPVVKSVQNSILCPQFLDYIPWRNVSLYETMTFTFMKLLHSRWRLLFWFPGGQIILTNVLGLSYLLIFLIFYFIFWQYIEKRKGQTSLQEMRRDTMIQRCVFMDEWSRMSGCVCPFETGCLKSSHLQKLCSQVLSLTSAIRPIQAELWRCGNENAVLVYLVSVCLLVYLPAVHEPVPADLLFSDFQTFRLLLWIWLWTSKVLTNTFSER